MAVLVALGTRLWLAAFRLSAEERRLAGVWRVEGPAESGGRSAVIEFEYRADRTYLVRHRDAATGTVLREWRDRWDRWRVRGGRLEIYSVRNPLPPRLGGAGELVEVTPSDQIERDGPDRVVLKFSPMGLPPIALSRAR